MTIPDLFSGDPERRCGFCERERIHSLWDVSYAMPDGTEWIGLDLEAQVCLACRTLNVEPGTLVRLGLEEAEPTMAVESERAQWLRFAAADDADLVRRVRERLDKIRHGEL